MSIKGVFSQEANAECDRIVKSKANILDINASNVRMTENEAIQTLYTLTKRTHPDDAMWKNPNEYK